MVAIDHSLVPQIVASDDVECAATDTTQLIAADYDRVKLIISNPADNTATFRVSDTNAAADNGFILAPGAGIVLDHHCGMAWSAYNPEAGAESLTVTSIKMVAAS